ncbi:hypothetical protein Drorol1_Dr00005670, partial [Drosera rotundifolia]
MPPEMDPQKSHFLTNPKKWSPHHRWVPPQSPLRLHRGLRRRRRRLIGKIIDENIVRIIILSKIFFLILPCKSFFFSVISFVFFFEVEYFEEEAICDACHRFCSSISHARV